MPKDQRESLKELIGKSKTMTPENRDALLEKLNSLDQERVNQLIAVFSKESEDIKEVEQKYREIENEMNRKYMDTVKNYELDGMRNALREEGKLDREDEKTVLGDLEGEMEEKPSKKTKSRRGKSSARATKEIRPRIRPQPETALPKPNDTAENARKPRGKKSILPIAVILFLLAGSAAVIAVYYLILNR